MISAMFSLQFGWPFVVAIRYFSRFEGIMMLIMIPFGYFGVKGLVSTTGSVHYDNRDKFIFTTTSELNRFGFRSAFQDGNVLNFKPMWLQSFLATPVCIQLDENTATLSGPKYYVERVIKLAESNN